LPQTPHGKSVWRERQREAVEAFIEEYEAIGTLEEILEEAGFVRQNGHWMARQPISAELVTIG